MKGTGTSTTAPAATPAGMGNSSLEALLVGNLRTANETGAPAGVLVGRLEGLAESGLPLVQCSVGNGDILRVAQHVCPIRREDVGREVVVAFEQGDVQKPIILGLLQPATTPGAFPLPVSVASDGEQLTLSARNEIVLRCGKASITLTRAGKVILRGAYLLSRSSGVNRIKGGSVQIN